MKTITSILLLLTIGCWTLFASSENKKEKICITEQEYEIYHLLGVGDYQNETTPYPFSERLDNRFPSISSETVADYNEKNSKTYLLRCVLEKDRKQRLTKTYGGMINAHFSRIGFNKDETEALVYVGWSGVGNTCESDFVHLKKENGKWTIAAKSMVVIC